MKPERDSLPVELPHVYVPTQRELPPASTQDGRGLRLSDLPRMAGYALLLFIAWLLFSTLLRPWLSSSATRAILDAPATLVTAPIDGTVTAVHTRPGDRLQPGRPVADVRNSTVTRDTLTSLQTRRIELRGQLGDLRNRIDSDRRMLAHVNHQYGRYHAASLTRIRGARASLDAEHEAAQARADAAATAFWRTVGLNRDGAASAAEVDAARAHMQAARGKADAIDQQARATGADLAAAADGIYLGGDGSDGVLPRLAQRRSDLRNSIQDGREQMRTLHRQLADLDALLDREHGRVDALSSYTVRADAGGVTQDVVAPVGARVEAGATLVRATDCDKAGVVAVFSAHQAPRLNKGTEIAVDIDGVSRPMRAHVVQLLPGASQNVQDGFSVPFPYAEDGSVYALARWDSDTPESLRRQACTPGRTVTASLM